LERWCQLLWKSERHEKAGFELKRFLCRGG